jgi:hypothetical protein
MKIIIIGQKKGFCRCCGKKNSDRPIDTLLKGDGPVAVRKSIISSRFERLIYNLTIFFISLQAPICIRTK